MNFFCKSEYLEEMTNKFVFFSSFYHLFQSYYYSIVNTHDVCYVLVPFANNDSSRNLNTFILYWTHWLFFSFIYFLFSPNDRFHIWLIHRWPECYIFFLSPCLFASSVVHISLEILCSLHTKMPNKLSFSLLLNIQIHGMVRNKSSSYYAYSFLTSVESVFIETHNNYLLND